MKYKDKFFSGCLNCIHFFKDSPNELYLYCAAYPDGKGIPEGIIMGIKHKKVRDDQIGEFVFEKVKINQS